MLVFNCTETDIAIPCVTSYSLSGLSGINGTNCSAKYCSK